MAKRGTINHPKNKRLARVLKTVPGVTQGLLETFWQWVGTYARDGAITAFDVEEILDFGGWLEIFTPEQVITAMTDELRGCRWLDLLEDGRFYVHDWHEHCDDAIHTGLYKAKQFFADGTKPKARGVYKEEASELKSWWDKAQFKPGKPVENQCNTAQVPVSDQCNTSIEPVFDKYDMVKPSQAKSKPSQSQGKPRNTPHTPHGEPEPPAQEPPKGGNSSPPLPEPAAPETSPGDSPPMVMLVHGLERKRGAGIPDPATATDEELLAYARKRRQEVQLDDPGGDAA